MVQIDFDKQQYYLILPDGVKIFGSMSQICNKLEEYSYTWNDIITLDEVRNILVNV